MAFTAEATTEERAPLITFNVDASARTLETESSTVAGALEEHGIEIDGEDLVTPDLSEEVNDGDTITVVLAKPVHLKVGQGSSQRYIETSVTVADVLEARGVKLVQNDWVKPGLSSRVTPKMAIKVTRVRMQERVKFDRVKARVEVRKTDKLYRGESKVIKPGRDARFKVFTESKVVDGKWRWTREVRRQRLRPSQPKVVLVGTKERQALSGVWAKLAQCESGGNPRIVSSNGLYHGLFQFSVGTWRSVGGSGVPSQASPAEQLKRAKILQARSGWGQWPHCSSQLGLR